MNADWPIKKLGELCEIKIGKTPRRGIVKYWTRGTLPWVKIAEVRGAEIINTNEQITETAAKELNMSPFPKGTILYTFKLSIGRVGIAGVDLFTNEAIAGFLIKDRKKLIPEWLFYVLPLIDYRPFLSNAVKGNTLNKNSLKLLPIPLPPLQTQKQIVERMDKIAKAQKLNDELIQKADELFQSLLYREFKLRNKDSELKSLRGLVELASGKTRPKEMTQDKTQIPVYGGNGIMGYSSNFLFQNDTIAIGRVGYYCGSIHFVSGHSWITDNAIYIRSHKGVNIEYLYYFLLTQNLNKFAGHSGQPKITQEPILNLKIFIPEVHLQKQIVEKLSAAQEYKKQLLVQKFLLKELFDSALDKSMKGEINNNE